MKKNLDVLRKEFEKALEEFRTTTTKIADEMVSDCDLRISDDAQVAYYHMSENVATLFRNFEDAIDIPIIS